MLSELVPAQISEGRASCVELLRIIRAFDCKSSATIRGCFCVPRHSLPSSGGQTHSSRSQAPVGPFPRLNSLDRDESARQQGVAQSAE